MQLPKTVCQDNCADDVVRRHERIVSEALNAFDISDIRELVAEIQNREDCGESNKAALLHLAVGSGFDAAAPNGPAHKP